MRLYNFENEFAKKITLRRTNLTYFMNTIPTGGIKTTVVSYPCNKRFKT